MVIFKIGSAFQVEFLEDFSPSLILHVLELLLRLTPGLLPHPNLQFFSPDWPCPLFVDRIEALAECRALVWGGRIEALAEWALARGSRIEALAEWALARGGFWFGQGGLRLWLWGRFACG